jgi:hypothetical protein
MASIVIRCSTTGAVHLEMIDYVDTSSFLLAVKRLLALRPRPSVFIADSGTGFKGGDSALQGITEKGAPHFLGLVERFVGAARAAIPSAVHAHTLTDEALRTVFGRAMGRLNNVPMAYTVKSEAYFHCLPLNPGRFLVGSTYAELQPVDTENAKLTNATRYDRVCSVLELFWKRLVSELTTHLNNWISRTRGVGINDIALLLDPARRGTTPLVRIARVRMGTDGEIRRVVCFDGFRYFDRALTSILIRCSTTGAVHLKMINYMDTSSFLLAVKRLLALRPRPSVFIADNGTNFKGGNSALKGITEKAYTVKS